jgi:hypothetical protein
LLREPAARRPFAEAALEVGQRLAQRALDRAAHHEPVEETSPPGSRLVLDRDPVRKLVVGLLEVAPMPRGGQAALLAGVLDQPVALAASRGASALPRPAGTARLWERRRP